MDARERYFQLLEKTIYESNYLYLLSQKYHQRRKWLEGSVAIVSSLALSAWVLHNALAIIYAAVIVASQLMTIFMSSFGIVKCDEATRQALLELQPLRRQVEMDWHRIDSESLTDEAIEKMILFATLERGNVLNKVMALSEKDDEKLSLAADRRANKYLENTFPDIEAK